MIYKGKTLVFIDTNKLMKREDWENDFSVFEPKGDFLKIVKFIEKNNLEQFVNLCIPEIVFEEVVASRNKNFNSNLDSLKSRVEKITSLPCCDFTKVILPSDEFNYTNFLKNIINDFIKNRKFITLLSLERKNYTHALEIIINKAIQKRKPFKDGSNDPGFKDAIIWETILNCNNITDYTYLFYLTENISDFKGLENSFKEKHSKDINFESATDLLIEELINIYDLHVKYPNILSYFKSEYFRDQIKDILVEEYNEKVKILEIKILDINELYEDDLFKYELSEMVSFDDLEILKKISVLIVSTSRQYSLEIIFDVTTNEIILANYR